MKDRPGNDYLEFPVGASGAFPDREVERREILLGEDTTNTCNIAMADVDGDGLDEIATPLTLGEKDCVRLYRGDGRLVWDNPDIRLYHAFYNDPSRPSGILHMWHKCKHRHVLTKIKDFDNDGKLEVIVGDGPVYVLDALTGAVKSVFDLGGRVALWDIGHDSARGMNVLIACADDLKSRPRIACVDQDGKEIWTVPTPGKCFCDCMHHGDLNLDGRPEIGFSIEEVKEFWVMDCDGRLLWKKNIPKELGDDPHIDDFLIDRILPEDRPEAEGNQLLLVTGPNLLDKNGNIIWSREDKYHHAQKVLAADFQPDRPGKEIYIVESYRRHAFLLTCDGEMIWEYDNFTKAREGYEYEDPRLGRAIGRLTTAGDIINWSGRGKTEIVQTEMGDTSPFYSGAERRKEIPPEEIRRFAHVLDSNGKAVSIFPIEDSPMCALAANVTASPGEDIVMVGHTTSRIYIYSKKI
ncbi:MAG: PQQ-binding-like beta-propeller repeat protein [Kiritimatiellia bacterium]|nr:PQQ-binding-like beta-propeller repeat protein [Kiritimatiellia bacterium]